MNQTLAQHRALTAYRASLEARAEARRLARREAVRARLLRRFFADRNGWLFAAIASGAALGFLLSRCAP